MRIFFSGPLTNLTNPEQTKAFYLKLDAVAKSLGYETFWAFLSGTDPIKNPDVSPQDVYNRDIKALDDSDMMIAYMGEPSTGTGVEIEHARLIGKPVVILYEKGKNISRMMRGCPAVKKEIAFETEDDALTKLEAYLSSYPKK
jgi:nucleoside 2-deoxyribosyltransferase